MARPHRLSPAQREEIARRLLAGDGVRPLAREFGVDPAVISRCAVAQQTQRVRNVAQQLAEAQTALEDLPSAQQYQAISLAERLRKVSDNLALAAEHGAETSSRLAAIAKSQVAKIKEDDPMESQEVLQAISALTKMSNDASAIPMALLNANNKAKQPEGGQDQPQGMTDAELERIASGG